jgi:hypothetical protein
MLKAGHIEIDVAKRFPSGNLAFVLILRIVLEIMKKPITPVSEVKSGKGFAELERSVHAALETYSNVHQGSGRNSMVSTYLFEQTRDIVLEYLGLKRGKYVVIFCIPRREKILKSLIKQGRYKSVSSLDIGLPLGVRALAVEKRVLPEGTKSARHGISIKKHTRGC